MPNPQSKSPRDRMPDPARVDASQVPPPKAGRTDEDAHEERLIDEAVDESFPASDPPAPAHPNSSLAVKSAAEKGRDTPPSEPDPRKKNVKRGGDTR